MPQAANAKRMGGDQQAKLPVRRLREWFGLKQVDFGRLFHQEQTVVAQLEAGKRTNLYPDIARATGVSMDYLYGYSDEMWGPLVHGLRAYIRESLKALSADDKAALTTPFMSQRHRISRVVEIAQRYDRFALSENLVRALLRLDEESYRARMSGQTFFVRNDYEDFAAYVGIPVAFFETGDLGWLDAQADLAEFNDVVAQLKARGVTAQHLAKLLDFLP
jgi:hypothetical protein